MLILIAQQIAIQVRPSVNCLKDLQVCLLERETTYIWKIHHYLLYNLSRFNSIYILTDQSTKSHHNITFLHLHVSSDVLPWHFLTKILYATKCLVVETDNTVTLIPSPSLDMVLKKYGIQIF